MTDMNSYHKTLLPALLTGLMTLLLSGCDKFLDIVPKGQVIPSTTSEYRATLNNGYKQAPGYILTNMRGITIDPQPDPFGMGLDEYESYKTIYKWEDTDNNSGRSESYPYYSYYKGIFFANSILLADAEKVREDDRQDSFRQLRAEAHALRAYYYFELANLYGPVWSDATKDISVVPINNTIDTEQSFPPVTLEQLYDQILADINAAKEEVQVDRYSDPRYRYRFSGEAIYALSSRIHLYRGEWREALDDAVKVLSISDKLEDLRHTGDKALLPMDYRSEECIISFTPSIKSTISFSQKLSDQLVELYEEGDLRIDKYFPVDEGYGYRLRKAVGQTYDCTIRRSEVYLTAAECLSKLGEDERSAEMLTTLLSQRLSPEALPQAKAKYSTLHGVEMVRYILGERLKEFAQECGHDWYDFRRSGQPELRKTIHGEEVVLQDHDPRYVIPLPAEARENNPYLSVK